MLIFLQQVTEQVTVASIDIARLHALSHDTILNLGQALDKRVLLGILSCHNNHAQLHLVLCALGELRVQLALISDVENLCRWRHVHPLERRVLAQLSGEAFDRLLLASGVEIDQNPFFHVLRVVELERSGIPLTVAWRCLLVLRIIHVGSRQDSALLRLHAAVDLHAVLLRHWHRIFDRLRRHLVRHSFAFRRRFCHLADEIRGDHFVVLSR